MPYSGDKEEGEGYRLKYWIADSNKRSSILFNVGTHHQVSALENDTNKVFLKRKKLTSSSWINIWVGTWGTYWFWKRGTFFPDLSTALNLPGDVRDNDDSKDDGRGEGNGGMIFIMGLTTRFVIEVNSINLSNTNDVIVNDI